MFLSPIGPQGVTMSVRVHPGQVCQFTSGSKSTHNVFRKKSESFQTVSYLRSHKYFVLVYQLKNIFSAQQGQD